MIRSSGAKSPNACMPGLKRTGGVRPPREFVLMDRSAIGLGGVFLRLKAELNWSRLFHGLIEDFDEAALARQAARRRSSVRHLRHEAVGVAPPASGLRRVERAILSRSPPPSRPTRPAVIPPSITNSDPVMWLDASEHRNSTPLAMSSAWPALPIGTVASAILFGSSGAFAPGGSLVQIGVSMTPGCTEFTRMLSRAAAHSSAIDLANSRTAPLVAL